MILIPYSTEVLIKRWPVSNIAIIGTCFLFYILLATDLLPLDIVEALILQGWAPSGLIGYQFLHAGLFHLIFNMLYLWVFGNAVCEKIGNAAFAVVFLLTGVLAAAVHNVFSDAPVVGASGAINGIIGFYLVLYPVNSINCFYWVFIRWGNFALSGFWLIIFWFVVDAWHAYSGAEHGIAYWAHVGGFLSGFVLGVISLKSGLAKMDHYDNPTLLDYMKGKTPARAGVAFERESFIRPSTLSYQRKPVPAPRKPAPPPVTPPPPPKQVFEADCPHCSQKLNIPQELIGQMIQCPSCNGEITLEE